MIITCETGLPPLPDVLTLQTEIDADAMTRIDASLREVYYERLIAFRARFLFSDRWNAVRFKLAAGLCIAGIAMALLFTALGGLELDGVRYDLWFAGLFAALLPVVWFFQKTKAWFRKPSIRFHQFSARLHADALIGVAKKNIPFHAHYVINGDRVAYARKRGESMQPLWSGRKLHGVRVAGDGFTLFFKKPGALRCHLIILHAPSPELDALFDRVGVAAEPSASAKSGPAAAAPHAR